MSEKAGTSPNIISLPEGGGAVSGIGESFSPDLFTGTGNFSVPISVPPGRGEFQPDLRLVYSTGNGNGTFGLGWGLGVPGIRRKTAKGVPQYVDTPSANPKVPDPDIFLLSGTEDLVLLSEEDDVFTYRPRTEGLYARIRHIKTGENNYWEVRNKNGNVSLYGTPYADWRVGSERDPATLADPDDPGRISSWSLTQTKDPFGNLIRYSYEHDVGEDGARKWEQLYLKKIEYVDYGNAQAPDFLVSVAFEYEDRLDPFSSFRSGFEIRTTRRCAAIHVYSADVGPEPIKEYKFLYAPDDELHSGASILKQVLVTGYDGQESQSLPALEFSYSDFEPELRKFDIVGGRHTPAVSLSHPTIETVDLNGNGLPDIVELAGSVARWWENIGDGEFSPPRLLKTTPQGLSLADPGVQFIDADGDGRPDLMVSRPERNQAGYFPMSFEDGWGQQSFQPYDVAPAVSFEDPSTTFIDLDGDGVTDVLRTGRTFECYFNDNDPKKAWKRTKHISRGQAKTFPDVDLASPRVRTADMTGDGLQDIVIVHDGRIDYWPNTGHGEFGPRITMQNAPLLPVGYRPEHVLLGDVDGSGCADLIYVEPNRVSLWINQQGNGFSEPIVIRGTPGITNIDALRLLDLYGTGTSGLLWSRNRTMPGQPHMFFLDFTGGKKPYLLTEMNNHMGAVTRVGYEPSTTHFLRDNKDPETRWKTPLPFPVQTVTRVEVIDLVSKGKLTTEYEYRHGYWDGFEREFRGFGEVIQRDTEIFEDYNSEGFFEGEEFKGVDSVHFAPPLETRHWFHLGPVYDPVVGWSSPDFTINFWRPEPEADVTMLSTWDVVETDLQDFSVQERRDALRTLRGSTLRTELYARDGSPLEDRPYVVTEAIQSVRLEESGTCGHEELSIFFPFAVASRTTNWDRGDDPASTFEFVWDHDEYGQPRKNASIACPRGWSGVTDSVATSDPFLSVTQETSFIHVDATSQYVVDRVSEAKSFEIVQDDAVSLVGLVTELQEETETSVTRRIQGHQRMYYDGDAYVGLSLGEIGDYGALSRSEQLVFTESILNEAYPQGQDAPDDGIPTYLASDSPTWTSYPQEFEDRIAGLDGRAGHVVEDVGGEEHFFVTSSRMKFDFQNGAGGGGRGLMLGSKDPLGHETTVTWDSYDLLPTQVTDPLGMTTQALYDYRFFLPKKVTDPNGNRSEVAFTPLGFMAATAVKGKEGESVGDTLQDPGTSYVYDLEAFDIDGSPVSVSTTTRVYHINDGAIPSGADPDETIEAIEYSDGFGRVIQARAQAEDLNFGDAGLTPTSAVDAEGTTTQEQRVRVTGWERYNNKGEVVEKWEPFFSEGYDFEDVSESPEGQSIKVFFDARGRTVRTLHPNGAEERVVFGIPTPLQDAGTSEVNFDIDDFEPTPWETYTFDANDNGGRSSLDASIDMSAFQSHFDTPASAVFDALGNVIEATQRNGRDPANWYVTKTTYDIRGNVIAVTDPKDRVASTQVYDLGDRVLRTESIDAGTSIIAFDAGGTPLESKNARGARELTRVDELLRPTHLWGQDSGSEPLRLVQHIVYGDDPTVTDPEDDNLLGKPYIHRDEAGKLTFGNYDFKGGLLSKIREVIDPALMIAAYEDADSGNNYEIETFRVDWTPGQGETFGDREAALLDGTDYEVDTTYDALGRPKTVTYPEDADNERKVLTPTFNRAGALQAVELDGTPYVEHIAYNARGQRILAAFGNGVMTRYAYDDLTFQLVRLRSEKYNKVGNDFEMAGDKVQDLRYTYDAAGNVLTIKSTGTGLGIDGHVGLDENTWGTYTNNTLKRLFWYDAIYRLTAATGREYSLIQETPWGDHTPGGEDYLDARPYRQEYEYDEVGSLTKKTHRYGDANETSGASSTTRVYTVESNSNRMTEIEAESLTYTYDAGGNLTKENTERHYEWDHAGNMRAFRVQPPTGQASVFGHYGYDAGGQRVQKVVCKSAGAAVSTVYIDGIFEHHRIHDDPDPEEQSQNTYLHVMDDSSRVAIVRIGDDIFSEGEEATKYHLGDHLGSSNVVLDSDGDVFNREEYRPYGESAFGSYAKKRYRFTGKERDEESGLYYHGARYYAPWLCRWTAADPAGMVDGVNLYAYVRGNPVRLVDPNGMQSGETTLEMTAEELQDQEERSLEFRADEDAAQVEPLQDRILSQDSPDEVDPQRGLLNPAPDTVELRNVNDWDIRATVSREGNNITISIPIWFDTDNPDHEPVIEEWIDTLEEEWSGQFGDYTVTTTVVTPTWGMVFNEDNWVRVDMREQTTRPTFDPVGNVLRISPTASGFAFSHEGGHFLGLIDRYSDVTFDVGSKRFRVSLPWSGWEDSIMSRLELPIGFTVEVPNGEGSARKLELTIPLPSGEVTERDIENVLRVHNLGGPPELFQSRRGGCQ